ncbi:MAG: rod shape-determining protein RodA [Actinomycetota bacterium]|nr:rod shape-determining protein RodA [Actinomycetota bacterium]
MRILDKALLGCAIALGLFGVIVIYSATYQSSSASFFKRQLLFFIAGIFFMFLGASFDYRKLVPYSRVIYFLSVFFLLPVFLFPAAGGAHRWISLGFFDFQPSEIAKLAIIITIASFVADKGMETTSNRDFLKAFGIAIIPMFFISIQPDMGMAFSIFVIFVGMMLIGGARARQIIALCLAGLGLFAGAAKLGFLKPYQISRVLTFVNPDMDPLHTGYNLLQSKIAIGSGKFLGKGLFGGTQTNLDFIPSHHTDFIFSVVGEELGFVGAAILLLLFGVLIWRGIKIASTAKDLFGTMLAAGITIMFLFQIVVNVGMTMGIVPITGITLPFMSYGGSSLVVSYFAVGLLLNVGMRRFPQGNLEL